MSYNPFFSNFLRKGFLAEVPTVMMRRIVACLILLMFPAQVVAQAPAKKADRIKPTAEHRQRIQTETKELQTAIDALRDRKLHDDHLADLEIYAKAATFIDRFDEYEVKGDAETVLDQIATSRSRALSGRDGQTPWISVAGSVVRGYRSEVDGSVQPYAVEIPSNLDRGKPARLDVVLHGRNTGLNESRFIKSHEGKKVPDDRPGLTLHVFGRTNNAYRWAGETDVFEAIKAVKRNYDVDDDRIVLRGFSMGGAGAWHLGLHYPAQWCSVEAGAGFTDTWKHARLDPETLPPGESKPRTSMTVWTTRLMPSMFPSSLTAVRTIPSFRPRPTTSQP